MTFKVVVNKTSRAERREAERDRGFVLSLPEKTLLAYSLNTEEGMEL